MKTTTNPNIPHSQTEAGQILSIVHGQPLTTLDTLLNEQSFTLQAMGFLNEVQLSQEFWDTRKDPIEDQPSLGLAMAALQLHLKQLTEQAQRLEMKNRN
ncbi:MAG: hypothetical protein KC587_08075 [Nitrospira sp.]|nr:hypothetical protein [Nitrospira sp.]MCA9456606.1 hypothetical protein [Nitrospira sp.]HQU29008.1 hypothetical protein [Nitrospirales bacterium]